jgi:hypothetical protein
MAAMWRLIQADAKASPLVYQHANPARFNALEKLKISCQGLLLAGQTGLQPQGW